MSDDYTVRQHVEDDDETKRWEDDKRGSPDAEDGRPDPDDETEDS